MKPEHSGQIETETHTHTHTERQRETETEMHSAAGTTYSGRSPIGSVGLPVSAVLF